MEKTLIEMLKNKSIERQAMVRKVADGDERRITFTIVSKSNAGERYDWWGDEIYIEEIDANGMDTSSCRTFFKDHEYRVDNAIGRVENIVRANGEIVADVVFASDDESIKIFNKYKEGVLSDVSVGYKIKDVKETKKKGEPTHVLITKSELLELSAVWKGFDKGAKFKREYEEKQENEAIRGYEFRNRKIKILEKLNEKAD
jgi:phage head maturation protease